MRFWRGLMVGLLVILAPVVARAQTQGAGVAGGGGGPAAAAAAGDSKSVPVGTVINAQNWQQYKDFMPDGMVKLFTGEYSLKMPADVQLEIGPTVIHPLPKSYVEATEKYSGQVHIPFEQFPNTL